MEETIVTLLVQTVQAGSPSSPMTQRSYETHKVWLTMFQPGGIYTKEGRLTLTESYVADAQFETCYDSIVKGSTEFLHSALAVYYS